MFHINSNVSSLQQVHPREGGAVFEQESKQFSTTVEMCLNTNKYGINYYVYGQEYVKKNSEIITFVFSFN